MYGRYGADPDEAVRRAWVVVRAAGARQPVGAGVVIADGYVLTCAHVVNAALGRNRMATAEPTAAELAAVELELPDAGTYAPRLGAWSAPVAVAEGWWDGDLALLRLPPHAPAVPPVRLAEPALGSTAWAWYADGDLRSTVDVIVQRRLGSWLLLDPGNAEVAVEPGYSGGPLWNAATGTLAGLIVSVEPDVARRRYYAIGPAAIQELLVRAGLAAPPPPRRDARQARLHRRLTDALDLLAPDRYDRGLVRFAAALGLPYGPRTPEEAADAALAHPRGLPALRDAFPESDEVRAAVAQGRPVRLLGPADHAELSALLAAVPADELATAAYEVARLLRLGADQVRDTAGFIEQLEDRDCEPGLVPPLLQVVEEVAAARAAEREELREWSTRVAARLLVRDGALEQVRAIARTRAGSRGTGRPVVRVWLHAHEQADAYSYVISLYDGEDRPLQTWSARDEARGHTVLCDELAEAVDRLADYGENAGVEFLLEQGSFGLPIDRWRIPTPLGPRLLGVDRFVVLRGAKPPKRGRWEQRWRCFGPAPSVVHDRDSAEGLLGEDPDAAFVIAACPTDEVEYMVAVCRYFGVPVMLWHRQAAGEEAARALLELATGDGAAGDDRGRAGAGGQGAAADGPKDLRERVRRRRLKARHDDRQLGAHLSLLWEDPRWDPPEVRLAEPEPLPVPQAVPVPLPEGGAA